MSKYYEGFHEAYNQIKEMGKSELLSHLDGLWGRDNLPDSPTLDDIRCEALAQTRRDWTDCSSGEYAKDQFWLSVQNEVKR